MSQQEMRLLQPPVDKFASNDRRQTGTEVSALLARTPSSHLSPGRVRAGLDLGMIYRIRPTEGTADSLMEGRPPGLSLKLDGPGGLC